MKLKTIIIVVSFWNGASLYAFELPSLDGIKSWLTFMKIEDVSYEYQVKLPAKIIVLNTYGNTSIETWNLPQVKITASKQARTEEALTATTIYTNLTTNDDQSIVTVETQLQDDDKVVVDYTIFVPKGTDIRISQHEKGSVLIKETSPQNNLGNVTVNTNKGSITVHTGSPISNNLILKTVKGNVTVKLAPTTQARIEAQTRKGTINSTLAITLDPVTTTLSEKNWKHMTHTVKGVLGTEAEGYIAIDVVSGNIVIERE
jgi:hypothetical protein